MSVCRKRRRYKEEQAKNKAIKKVEDGDEHEEPSENDDSDAEDDSVNVMDEYFQEPAGNEKGQVNSHWENH